MRRIAALALVCLWLAPTASSADEVPPPRVCASVRILSFAPIADCYGVGPTVTNLAVSLTSNEVRIETTETHYPPLGRDVAVIGTGSGNPLAPGSGCVTLLVGGVISTSVVCYTFASPLANQSNTITIRVVNVQVVRISYSVIPTDAQVCVLTACSP